MHPTGVSISCLANKQSEKKRSKHRRIRSSEIIYRCPSFFPLSLFPPYRFSEKKGGTSGFESLYNRCLSNTTASNTKAKPPSPSDSPQKDTRQRARLLPCFLSGAAEHRVKARTPRVLVLQNAHTCTRSIDDWP